MKKYIIFNSIYLVLIVSIVLLGSGIIKLTTECKFYELFYSTRTYMIILFSIIPTIGYIISKILKYKKEIQVIYYVIIPLIPIYIMFSLIESEKEKLFKTNKHIVTKGIVVKKDRYPRTAYLKIAYFSNLGKGTFTKDIKPKYFKKINIGDTILVRYDIKCTYLIGIFKLFPTKVELEQCKNDCYLMDGILTPIKIE